jgi:murein L,D-transpeptidase YafK
MLHKTSLISILLLFVLSPLCGADDVVPRALVLLGNGTYFSSTAIVVDKSERKLTVWEFANGIYTKKAEFPSDLGRQVGPKIARGDKRTPEGVYFLEKQLEGPSLSFQEYGVRAFTTSYPNFFDRRDGKTGDGIWLHAVPDKVSLERGSKGCVVVRNEAILAISKFIKPGQTPIIISDKIDYQPITQTKTQSESMTQMLANWKKSWESKDLDGYMSYYDSTFKNQKMDLAGWRAFKKSLYEKYQNIQVTLSEPIILQHGNRVVVRALQQYKSDLKEDFGEKTLYLEKRDDGYKIVAEDWVPASGPEAIQALSSNSRSAAAAN